MPDWGKLAANSFKIGVIGLQFADTFLKTKAASDLITSLINASPEEAGTWILVNIPQMDEDQWTGFANLLATRARVDRYAQELYRFAHYVYNANANMQELLTQPVSEATDVIAGMFSSPDPGDQVVYSSLLILYANANNMKAKSILGHLNRRGLLSG